MNKELKVEVRRVAMLLCVLLLVPLTVRAQVEFESQTLLRAFERDTAQKQDAMVLPVYEYLHGRVAPSDGVISFHLSGWGRIDAADEGYYQDDTAGELMYGYLEYRPAGYNVNLRAGRQYLFGGVSNEALDGVAIAAEANNGLLFSLYGGLPVALSTTSGIDGDALYGGRIGHRGVRHEIGVSYKMAENDSQTAQETVGSDLSLFLPGGVSVFGVSRYNLETDNFAEHSYEANLDFGSWRFRPFVERYRYEDYFNAGAKTVNPFRFLAVQDEVLTVAGTDLAWRPDAGKEFTFRVKALDYDQADTAYYGSAALTLHGNGATSYGAEVGRLEGDLSRDSYTLARAFAYLERLNDSYPLEFISADLVLAFYDEDIRGQGDAYFVSLGTGRNLMNDMLKLKAVAEYSADPYYSEDLRGFVSATYLFAP